MLPHPPPGERGWRLDDGGSGLGGFGGGGSGRERRCGSAAEAAAAHGAPSSSVAGGVVRPIGPGLSLGIGGSAGLASPSPRNKRRVARLIEQLLRVGAEHEVCSFERCRQ